MTPEGLAFTVVLLLAGAIPAVWAVRRRLFGTALAVGALLGTCLAWGLIADRAERPTLHVARPLARPEQGYVTSDTCRTCHPAAYASWHASFHRTMTQVPGHDNVAGDFDGTTLELGEFVYRLQRDGDELRVAIEPPPGGHLAHPGATDRRVVLMTGSHHYQVYWLDTPNGREVEQFPLAWLRGEERFVSRAATLLMPYQEFRGTRSGSWNSTCIRCHTTHGRPRLDEGGQVDSEVSEFGIACEACHGPAEEHVRRHREPTERYAARFDDRPDPTIVNPRRVHPRRSAEICGQCHGITELRETESYEDWLDHGYRFRPGDELGTTRSVVQMSQLLRTAGPTLLADARQRGFFEARFWSDGMLRVVGRELNGLLDTPCFVAGEMSCLSCHSMHETPDDPRPLREWAVDQLAPGGDGDAACTQCHEGFETTTALERHTHHAAASDGSRCLNCHMPYTTYGLLKATRSHTVDSPDVAASVRAGRPNACNQCHLDRTLEWTADQLDRWYGIDPPPLAEDERRVAASLLWLLRGDAGQRAITAWSMAWPAAQQASGRDWIAPHLARLLDDPYEAVRLIAHRSLRSCDGFAEFEHRFEGGAADRSQVVEDALACWRKTRQAGRTDARLLFDAQGELDETAVRELLARRDDRVVWLTE